MGPLPDWAFYANEFRGGMGEEEFAAALPEAAARLSLACGGAEPSPRDARAWAMACCSLADWAAGWDTRGALASETVGGVTLSYREGAGPASDYEAALPWLAGTGLLCRAVPLGGGRRA